MEAQNSLVGEKGGGAGLSSAQSAKSMAVSVGQCSALQWFWFLT